MTITISFSWWMIPTLVTVLSMLWALYWPADDSGLGGGIVRLFMLVPALAVSLIAWVIFAILK